MMATRRLREGKYERARPDTRCQPEIMSQGPNFSRQARLKILRLKIPSLRWDLFFVPLKKYRLRNETLFGKLRSSKGTKWKFLNFFGKNW